MKKLLFLWGLLLPWGLLAQDLADSTRVRLARTGECSCKYSDYKLEKQLLLNEDEPQQGAINYYLARRPGSHGRSSCWAFCVQGRPAKFKDVEQFNALFAASKQQFDKYDLVLTYLFHREYAEGYSRDAIPVDSAAGNKSFYSYMIRGRYNRFVLEQLGVRRDKRNKVSMLLKVKNVSEVQFKQFDFTVAGNKITRIKQRWGTRKLDSLRGFCSGCDD